MPRVKRGVTARARHKKVLDQAKGFRGRRKNVYRIAKEAVMRRGSTPTATAATRSASSARCGSRASTRRRASRADLQRVHERAEEGRDRGRPQGARRPRGVRQAGVWQDRRAGQSEPRGLSDDADANEGGSRRRLLFFRSLDECEELEHHRSPQALAPNSRALHGRASRLEQAKARYLGKTGALTELLKGLGKLSADERPAAGARDQRRQGAGRGALARAPRGDPRRAQLDAQLAAEALDVTLPGRGQRRGRPASDHAHAGARRGALRTRWASRSPTAPRSRTTSTTSPR